MFDGRNPDGGQNDGGFYIFSSVDGGNSVRFEKLEEEISVGMEEYFYWRTIKVSSIHQIFLH